MGSTSTLSTVLALTGLLAACSTPDGPLVWTAPDVELAQFESTLITPEVIRFETMVRITNRMRGPLEIASVEYGADLHDRPLFSETFTELLPMDEFGTQRVRMPFQVSMQDIANQVEDVLAEEGIRVTFHGTVYPVGFDPIPFESTVVIPPTAPPLVAICGVRGTPLAGDFIVYLELKNVNSFPMTVSDVDTYLDLNGKKYDLLRTESQSSMGPGQSGRIALTLRNSTAKGLSMLINVAKNGTAHFTLGGSIACQTPHGVLLLPVALSSS